MADDWRSETFDRTNPRHMNTGFAIDTMHLSCKDGDLDLLKSMIEHKNKIHRLGVNWRNRRGATALMTASQYGHVDCVKYLIRMKAKVDAKRRIDGSTPLVIAAKNGRLECVKVLLETVSYPKILEQQSIAKLLKEALERSRLLPRKQVPDFCVRIITEFAVSPAADPTITNDNGYNAIQIAANYGFYNIVDYLSEYRPIVAKRISRAVSSPTNQPHRLVGRGIGITASSSEPPLLRRVSSGKRVDFTRKVVYL